MQLESLNWLISPAGAEILADLALRELRESDLLRELDRLRRLLPADQARAAVELAVLRRRARAKFPHADRMFFTREALEQASAAPVAAHRAARIAQLAGVASAADLCCGIGGDALALAAAGLTVTAVDRDPLRLQMVLANAHACALAERVQILERDLLVAQPPPADLVFCDPGRRSGGRRQFSLESYEPPLSRVLSWREVDQPLVIKLAPGLDPTQLPENAELEFVSLDGELKEAVLWFTSTAIARRATLLRRLPGGTLLHHELLADPAASVQVPITPPLAWLYEPDPAVIRSGLVRDLAVQLGAGQLDPQIAYLTGDQYRASPFARAWPILEWLPFQLKQLSARLRAYNAGAVTVKKRGSPLDTDALARKLSGSGDRELVVVLTQAAAKPIVLICDPPVAADSV